MDKNNLTYRIKQITAASVVLGLSIFGTATNLNYNLDKNDRKQELKELNNQINYISNNFSFVEIPNDPQNLMLVDIEGRIEGYYSRLYLDYLTSFYNITIINEEIKEILTQEIAYNNLLHEKQK